MAKVLAIVLGYPPIRFVGAEIYDHQLFKAMVEAGHSVTVKTIEFPSEPYILDGVSVNPADVDALKPDLIITHLELRQKAWHHSRVTKHRPPIGAIQHNFSHRTQEDERLYMWDFLIFNSDYCCSLSRNPHAKHTEVLIPPVESPGRLPLSKGKAFTQINLAFEKGGDIFWKLAEANPEQEFIAVRGGWGNQIIPSIIPENVTLLEHQSDLTPVWKKTGGLLFLSQKIESWGMVVGEAARHGIPSLMFSDLYGPLENAGGSAVIVDRGSSLDVISEAMLTLKPSKATQAIARRNASLHAEQLGRVVTMLEAVISEYKSKQ